MRASVVRIGNSRGIRIPKAVLKQCRLGSTVELEMRRDHLVVRPVDEPRAGWEDAFRQMAQERDDVLLDRESLPQTRWDATKWEW